MKVLRLLPLESFCVLLFLLIALAKGAIEDEGQTFGKCIYEDDDLNEGKSYSLNYLTKDVFNYTSIHHLGRPIHTYFMSNQFSVKVNLCGNVGTCNGRTSMAVLEDQKGTKEDNPSTSSPCYSMGDVISQNYVKFDRQTEEQEHLILKFKSTDKCFYNSEGEFNPVDPEDAPNFGLSIEMLCDQTMNILNKPIISNNEDSPDFDICHPKIYVKSLYGCKISKIETVAVFFDTYSWIFGVIFILFGLYNLTYGGRMFRLTIVLFSIASTIAISCLVFFFILQIEDPSQTMIAIILLSSSSLGAIIGWFLVKTIKVGICVIGCWTGVILAIAIDSLIFARFGIPYILYILIFTFVIAFGYLACKYYEYVLIFSSSILGSYFFIRGISFEVGGYPNELDILEQLKHGTYVEIPWSFYLYFFTIAVFSIFGVVFQVRRLNKKGKKKDKKKKVVKKEEGDIEMEEGKKQYDQMTQDES